MYQQQPPPQWQPPPVRPRKQPNPRTPWLIGAGVGVFMVVAVIVALVKGIPADSPQSASSAPAPARTSAASPSSPPLSARVTKAQFGKDWPFVHITAGTVRCIPRGDAPGEVIFVADDGRTFGLNGTALGGGYKDIPKGEWRKDPRYPGTDVYVGIGPLRDPVAKACGL